ncbi:hypothetical protein [Nocardia aurea]|uniref:Uncharacterized protein n=1 Tax=Nocardia aurea TaxID=2144174 RepID=A0ABV3G1B2_9NOCA
MSSHADRGPPTTYPTGDTEIVHYEVTEDGIERIAERIYVTTPFTGKDTTP